MFVLLSVLSPHLPGSSCCARMSPVFCAICRTRWGPDSSRIMNNNRLTYSIGRSYHWTRCSLRIGGLVSFLLFFRPHDALVGHIYHCSLSNVQGSTLKASTLSLRPSFYSSSLSPLKFTSPQSRLPTTRGSPTFAGRSQKARRLELSTHVTSCATPLLGTAYHQTRTYCIQDHLTHFRTFPYHFLDPRTPTPSFRFPFSAQPSDARRHRSPLLA